MTQDLQNIKKDRMLYTKDKTSANLILLAIVLDALYFISIYKQDIGSYYYTWEIGASIIINLLFLLTAFLASEGVKNRRNGYTAMLIILGVVQFIRVDHLPWRAHLASIEGVRVMEDTQYYFVIGCLILSGICCVAAAVTSFINTKNLQEYVRSLENKSA